jgi:hypothetical protein
MFKISGATIPAFFIPFAAPFLWEGAAMFDAIHLSRSEP